jgi:heme oxygenase
MEERSLRTFLKNSTQEVHLHLESLPFFIKLKSGVLAQEEALQYLKGLYELHKQFESRTDACSDRRKEDIWKHTTRRAGLLRADLEEVGQKSIVALRQARIDLKQFTFAGLMGVMYVLEGSQLGGTFLRSSFARALNISVEKFRYYPSNKHDVGGRWKEFCRSLDKLTFTEDERGDVLDGASYTFNVLAEISKAAINH